MIQYSLEQGMTRVLEIISETVKKTVLKTFQQKNLTIEQVNEIINRHREIDGRLSKDVLSLLERLIDSNTRYLLHTEKVIIPVRKDTLDLGKFLEAHPKIFMQNSFLDRMGMNKQSIISSAPGKAYNVFVLNSRGKAMAASFLSFELPEDHISAISDILFLLENQPTPKTKGLLVSTSEYTQNLFFLKDVKGESFLASVRAQLRTWEGHVWEIDGHSLNCYSGWSSGSKIFCPTSISIP